MALQPGPGKPGELTDELEAVPARLHLLHLLPGFSPHQQGEQAGGRDCAWAASHAVRVPEAAGGWLVWMGMSRKQPLRGSTLSPLPGTLSWTGRTLFWEAGNVAWRRAQSSICGTHLNSQTLGGGSRRIRVQGHFQLHQEFEASLRYLKLCLK